MQKICEEQRAAIVRKPCYILWINDERPRTLMTDREVSAAIHSALMVTGEADIRLKKVMQ